MNDIRLQDKELQDYLTDILDDITDIWQDYINTGDTKRLGQYGLEFTHRADYTLWLITSGGPRCEIRYYHTIADKPIRVFYGRKGAGYKEKDIKGESYIILKDIFIFLEEG